MSEQNTRTMGMQDRACPLSPGHVRVFCSLLCLTQNLGSVLQTTYSQTFWGYIFSCCASTSTTSRKGKSDHACYHDVNWFSKVLMQLLWFWFYEVDFPIESKMWSVTQPIRNKQGIDKTKSCVAFALLSRHFVDNAITD